MKILKEPEVLEKLKSLAFVPAKESRQEFEAYIALENVKWRRSSRTPASRSSDGSAGLRPAS